MRKTISTVLIASVVFLLGNTGCGPRTSTADKREAAETQRLTTEASNRLGLPGITNFQEKAWAKELYELRDQAIATYTYAVDLDGHLHHVCDSVGYGIPASVQYSNPEREVFRSSQGGHGTLPQAEPNGLFMPEGLSATYVLCVAEGGAGFVPLYVEPQILVSQARLLAEDSWQPNPPAEQAFQ